MDRRTDNRTGGKPDREKLNKQRYDTYRHEKIAEFQENQERLQMNSIHSKAWRRSKIRLITVFFVCVLSFFVFQIFRWQSFAGESYAVRTLTQIINRYSAGDRIVMPMRGSITDRNLQALAISSTVYNMFVDVRMLASRGETDFDNNRRALTEFFGMSLNEFNQIIAADANGQLVNDTHFLRVRWGISHAEWVEFENWRQVQGILVRDVHFEEDSTRNYIHNTLAAPVIGFQRGTWWGLEFQYNDFLVGTAGRNMTTFDSNGNVVTDRVPPIHGANIVTTLDIMIQRVAEDVAARWARSHQASFGSVIVMQPFTGEIIAMAQYPGFDANFPVDLERITSDRLAEHIGQFDTDSPEFWDYLFGIWANFNITSTFEQGSIYKSVVVAKALEEGVISPNQTFYCIGFTYRAGHRIHCFNRRGHGLQTLTQALANSCNMAHIEIAEAVGRQLFWQYQRDFGFGIPTGIDFPGEASGLVHTVAELNESELATASFGQRFNATPIQAISSFAPLINGGNVMRPFFVSQIIDADGNIILHNTPTVERRVISQDTSDWMRMAMEYVVTEGTGRPAAIEGFRQGGKTATGEQGVSGVDDDFSYSLSYIGYFPIDNPQYLIMVLLHDIPTEIYYAGYSRVSPMYREVAQEIIRLRGLPLTDTIENPGTMHESEFIEDFVGLTVQQAITRLNSLVMDYEFIGASGNTITSQFPVAGSRSTGSSRILLHLGDDGVTPVHDVPVVIGLTVDFAREVLISAGFVPRFVYAEHVDHTELNDDIQAIVYGQPAYNVRLPHGTEILLRAAFNER